MKKSVLVLGCLGAVAAVVLFLGVGLAGFYNSLVRSAQRVDQQWAQVENVYQRRADLIPNLVATVSGAANFEKSTLEEVTQARASVGKIQLGSAGAPVDPARLAEFQTAQDKLGSALSRLLVVVERYPELRATANFRDLQAQLEGTENRITVERQTFNQVVQVYNTRVKGFPGVVLAPMLGFPPKPYFAAREGSDQPPRVQFDFGAPAPVQRQP